MNDVAPYQDLTPDCILDAVEGVGYVCSGRFLALNSYENRVYQIGIEDAAPLVAKFYRPQRWSHETILEEHAFAAELAEHEIPVVAPLVGTAGQTLYEHAGYSFALYPNRPGRPPELDDFDTLTWLGRFLGRIHAVGAIRPFLHRPTLDVEHFGDDSLGFLLAHDFIPRELAPAYSSIARDLLQGVREIMAAVGPVKSIRLHGDCHPGNIMWTPQGPQFVDLDDARMGPAVQDLWMLLSGDRQAMQLQLDALLEGYCQFHDFDARELALIEPLRSLRLMHYAAWLARRWHDPAFPHNFPWFNTARYWQDHILNLREQLAALAEPPLMLL